MVIRRMKRGSPMQGREFLNLTAAGIVGATLFPSIATAVNKVFPC